MSMEECGDSPRARRIRRLRYQSWHRGCKETDWLLGHYCDRHLNSLSDEALGVYEAFLAEDDADIWAWTAYGEPPPKKEYQSIINLLRKMSAPS